VYGAVVCSYDAVSLFYLELYVKLSIYLSIYLIDSVKWKKPLHVRCIQAVRNSPFAFDFVFLIFYFDAQGSRFTLMVVNLLVRSFSRLSAKCVLNIGCLKYWMLEVWHMYGCMTCSSPYAPCSCRCFCLFTFQPAVSVHFLFPTSMPTSCCDRSQSTRPDAMIYHRERVIDV
jgi:hypothetical protein